MVPWPSDLELKTKKCPKFLKRSRMRKTWGSVKVFLGLCCRSQDKRICRTKRQKNKLLLDVGGDFFFCSAKNVRDRSFFFSVPFNKTPTKVHQLLNWWFGKKNYRCAKLWRKTKKKKSCIEKVLFYPPRKRKKYTSNGGPLFYFY